MENNYNANFIRGAVELLILNILLDGECYGYQISQLIEEHSGKSLKIPVGTLYPAFYRLEEKGYIRVEQRIVEKRMRVYYQILDAGRAYYDTLLADYESTNGYIRCVLYRE
jgi:PadR family transcriptional regulator PadR